MMNVAIFKVNHLGDNVVFLPVIQALRQLRPDWRLTLITSAHVAELYAADIPSDDLLAVVPQTFRRAWRRPWQFARWTARLRARHLDATLLSYDQGYVAHGLAWLSGGPVRVGSGSLRIRMGGTLTHRIVRAPEWSMAQWNWEMARAILAAVDDARDWPATPPAPNLSHLVDEKSGRTKQVVVHAGSNQSHTRWPLERFVELASRLARDHRVLWIETPETRAAILPGNIVRLETPNLTALARALASAALFVGNNSGPMHVAVALGTPSVVVSGASAYAWDSPWHREKVQLLRTPNLACLPCEAAEHSPGRCINDREPLACLKRWDVAALEAACRNSLLRWAGV